MEELPGCLAVMDAWRSRSTAAACSTRPGWALRRWPQVALARSEGRDLEGTTRSCKGDCGSSISALTSSLADRPSARRRRPRVGRGSLICAEEKIDPVRTRRLKESWRSTPLQTIPNLPAGDPFFLLFSSRSSSGGIRAPRRQPMVPSGAVGILGPSRPDSQRSAMFVFPRRDESTRPSRAPSA